MSYATIRTALATRLGAVSGGPSVVHSRIRWTNDNADGSVFQALFMGAGARLNFAQFTRKTRRSSRSPQDARRIVRHDLEIYLSMALDDADTSETLFQDMLEAIAVDLETGDRTLGTVCKTHSDPEILDIGHEMRDQILCHGATIKITVEEVLA